MRIKTLIHAIPFALGLIVAALAAPAAANQFCESQVIRAWLDERDAAATQLVRVWLGGGDEAAVRRLGVELVRLEVLLAPCAPPLRIEEFYIGEAGEPERLPGHVLVRILARQGIDIDAPAFFNGRTFRFRAPEAAR